LISLPADRTDISFLLTPDLLLGVIARDAYPSVEHDDIVLEYDKVDGNVNVVSQYHLLLQ